MSFIDFLLESKMVDVEKLKLTKNDSEEAKKIAKMLGVKYDGYWEDINKYMFTDENNTGTSITAATYDELEFKLNKARKDFEKGRSNVNSK
jgi:hypothetical protein